MTDGISRVYRERMLAVKPGSNLTPDMISAWIAEGFGDVIVRDIRSFKITRDAHGNRFLSIGATCEANRRG
jgi:hypothetical protein